MNRDEAVKAAIAQGNMFKALVYIADWEAGRGCEFAPCFKPVLEHFQQFILLETVDKTFALYIEALEAVRDGLKGTAQP